MDLFKQHYDKYVQGYSLNVTREKSRVTIFVTDEENPLNRVLLKTFNSERNYQRFLAEAVCLRLQAKDSAVKQVRSVYKKIVDFLNDKTKKSLTFLLAVFLLCSCSSDFAVEQSKTEIVTVSGEKFCCQYTRGSSLSCRKYEKGVNYENEEKEL